MKWVDRGKYVEFTAPQKSESWLQARIGIVTSTTGSALAGKSSFKTPEQIGKIIAGVETEVFSERSLEHMKRGNDNETPTRIWFEKTYNCKVLERGLCISKSDPLIGGSVDGDIVGTDGCIEIKCPEKMYKGILSYTENVEHGWVPPADYYEHILPTHLHQCMQNSWVLGKKYCIYIVNCISTGQIFTQKIPFSQKYWDEVYPIIKKNYELYVRPHLKK